MSDSRELTTEQTAPRGGAIAVSGSRGALVFEKFSDIVDFSMMMSRSDKAVPKFLRGNPGACMAVTIQATEWGFSPFQVARMAYEVNDQIAYMAQLIHAVVEKRAPLKSRLKFYFEGEGPELRVIVTGHFRDEVDPCVYESPRFKDIKVKNSPLWSSDPRQQFTYYGSRAWARRFCPDVILGVYADDELDRSENIGADNAKNVTPPEQALHHRLSAKAVAGAGFDPKAISDTIDEASGRPAPAEPAKETAPVVLARSAGAQAAPEPAATSPAVVEAGAAEPSPPADDAEGSSAPEMQRTSEAAAAEDAPAAAAEPEPEHGPVHVPPTVEPSVEPEPQPAYQKPAPPTDGRGYLEYARRRLEDPGMATDEQVRIWWGSAYEKKLRALPNLTNEDFEAAKMIVTGRIAELKAAK